MTKAFGAAVLLGSFLLFVIQPALGKWMLPHFGGGPSVWNVCMLFFQGVLLLGYGYAHFVTRTKSRALQGGVHAAVCAAALFSGLNLGRDRLPLQEQVPALSLLWELTRSAGLPVFVVAATAPLLQRWYSRTSAPGASDPYFFYAGSNAASLLGLLSYPLAIEPWFPLRSQFRYWTAGFACYVLLILWCGGLFCRRPAEPVSNGVSRQSEPVSVWRHASWIVLAMVPASLSLATTQFLCTDVAPIPLLWALPLGTYLSTWILAFSSRVRIPCLWVALGFSAASVAVAVAGLKFDLLATPTLIGLHLGQLFFAGLLCHTRLAQSRPAPDRLTEFYLLTASGGVLGAAFNSLLAPVVFDWVWEYPLGIIAVCALGPWQSVFGRRRAGWGAGVALGGILAVLWIAGPVRREYLADVVARGRSFFGVYSVKDVPGGVFRVLRHGTTDHGLQRLRPPEARHEPLSYFHRQTPIGALLAGVAAVGDGSEMRPLPHRRRVAVIGMGTGTLAAYSRPGDEYIFYEIDPQVDRIARDPRLFTYVQDALGTVRTVLGDGRLKLGAEPDGSYDLIVVDAFTSDSIPVHLLTVEAFSSYVKKLAPGGLVAVHISNRFVDLEPEIAAVAGRLAIPAMSGLSTPSLDQIEQGKLPSRWVVLGRFPADLEAVWGAGPWVPLPSHVPGREAWTDDLSNLGRALCWRRPSWAPERQ